MTLNDPECPIQLKVHFPDGTPTYMFLDFGVDHA